MENSSNPQQPIQSFNNSAPAGSSKILFLILGAIILMCLSALGGYLLGAKNNTASLSDNQTASPTINITPTSVIEQTTVVQLKQTASDLNTYEVTDQVAGKFTIMIPKDLHITSTGDGDIEISDLQNVSDLYTGKVTPIGHQLYTISPMQDHRGDISDADFEGNSSFQQIIINGIAGWKGTGRRDGRFGIEEKVIFPASHNGNDYISFIYQLGDKKVFDQVLSTFKFTQ